MANKLVNKLKFLSIRVVVPAILRALFGLRPSRPETVLIIKTDGIGDYILFRNYLSFLKGSEKFRNCKLYVLGNPVYKDLTMYLDQETVDGFFWYNDGYFMKWKLLRLLFDLQLLKVNHIIYAGYSRKATIDWVVKNIHAEVKTGMAGNLNNQSRAQQLKGNHYYDTLIDTQQGILHEFERNKQFFEAICGEQFRCEKPWIKKESLKVDDHQAIMVFTGASEKNRKWSNKNFSELCNLLMSQTGKRVILTGGADEITDGEEIQRNLRYENYQNMIGKLNLVELCGLVAGATLVICSDTVAVHLAVALNINAVCISRGDLYRRFVPYPASFKNDVNVVLPPGFMESETSFNNWSLLNINTITVNQVFNAAEVSLSSNKQYGS